MIPAPHAAPLVVGIDLALSSTGVARSSGRLETVFSRGAGYARHWSVAVAIDAVLAVDNPDLVALEDYAPHGAGLNALIRVAEVGGIIRTLLERRHYPTALIRPSTLKAFATGRGNAPKADVFNAALEAGAKPTNTDEADAYWLARMGRAHLKRLGDPLELIPEHQARALDAVAWPDVTISAHHRPNT